LAEHRNPQSCLPVRNTQQGARSLAGQADCSAVTLEGSLPPSNNPNISEFLRNFELVAVCAGNPMDTAFHKSLLVITGITPSLRIE